MNETEEKKTLLAFWKELESLIEKVECFSKKMPEDVNDSVASYRESFFFFLDIGSYQRCYVEVREAAKTVSTWARSQLK